MAMNKNLHKAKTVKHNMQTAAALYPKAPHVQGKCTNMPVSRSLHDKAQHIRDTK